MCFRSEDENKTAIQPYLGVMMILFENNNFSYLENVLTHVIVECVRIAVEVEEGE